MQPSETEILETTLGELVEALYETFLETYEDPDLAAVATSALLQEHFAEGEWDGDPITLAA